MKNSHLLLGFLLIFIGGIILSISFGESEKPQKTKPVESKQLIEESSLGSSVDDQVQTSLSPIKTKAKKTNEDSNDTINNIAVPLDTLSVQEREAKRMLAIEYRKERIAERKRYKSARIEWRKALNEARKEAKLSGDYSKYEAIKQQEPGKE